MGIPVTGEQMGEHEHRCMICMNTWGCFDPNCEVADCEDYVYPICDDCEQASTYDPEGLI